ncbi:MAG: YibE/F family protein [Acidimicrobiia bacterium]|nr:YibE/F family protein [Acidimicrobiia bacterium]
MAVTLVGIAALVGLAVLWPGRAQPGESDFELRVELVKARVVAIDPETCAGIGGSTDAPACVRVTAEVTSGTTKGEVARFQMVGGGIGASLSLGDRIVLSHAPEAPPQQRYQFSDFERDRPLVLLAVLFALAVVALGRWKGLRALLGVAASVVALVTFVLPALLGGSDALAVVVVAAALLAFVALYVTHGVTDTTTVALAGTLASLALTGLLGWLFVRLTQLTGFASEESGFLRATSGDIDLRGVLLAGIVIGSLGVLDDVTVTQVSTVSQVHSADPALGRGELYRRGLEVGRDHIASTVNTLVLAYAGSSLPLLLLFTQTARPVRDVLTGEVVATEVVRTLVGSIGLVASVPLTTWLAAWAVTTRRRE